MLRVKVPAKRLKDLEKFYSYKAEDKYEEFIEPCKILEEKGFEFPKRPIGTINTILIAAIKRGWIRFCADPQDPVILVLKELYSNLLKQALRNITMRQVQVPLDSRVINVFL